jgi:hypothetical protein
VDGDLADEAATAADELFGAFGVPAPGPPTARADPRLEPAGGRPEGEQLAEEAQAVLALEGAESLLEVEVVLAFPLLDTPAQVKRRLLNARREQPVEREAPPAGEAHERRGRGDGNVEEDLRGPAAGAGGLGLVERLEGHLRPPAEERRELPAGLPTVSGVIAGVEALPLVDQGAEGDRRPARGNAQDRLPDDLA